MSEWSFFKCFHHFHSLTLFASTCYASMWLLNWFLFLNWQFNYFQILHLLTLKVQLLSEHTLELSPTCSRHLIFQQHSPHTLHTTIQLLSPLTRQPALQLRSSVQCFHFEWHFQDSGLLSAKDWMIYNPSFITSTTSTVHTQFTSTAFMAYTSADIVFQFIHL